MEIIPGTRSRSGQKSKGSGNTPGGQPPEPPKPTLQDYVLRYLAVFVTIAYAWLTASMLQPQFPIPKNMINQVAWILDAQAKTVSQVKPYRYQEVEMLEHAVRRTEPMLRTIGYLRHPVTLVINVDQPKRYTITEERVEIGANYISNPGEVERAFLKAWLYQKAKPEIISSIFRVEVAAEALAQMILQPVTFEPRPKLQNWLRVAASYEKLCQDKTIPHELESACGTSQALAPVAFTNLLASMIVNLQDELPPIDRLAFTQEFAKQLEEVKGVDATLSLNAQPSDLNEWKTWLRSEFNMILPEAGTTPKREQVMKEVGINDESTARLDYFFLHESEVEQVGDAKTLFLLRSQATDRSLLFPGRVELTSKDVDQFGSTRWLVWESCRVPKLGEVLQKAVRAQKIIYLQTCGKRRGEIASAFEILMKGGIEAFAKAEPDIPFLQMKADAVDLALRKGAFEKEMPLTVYMEKGSGGVNLLGLDTAVWKREMRAYKVLGAIEAVEWFRSPETSN